MINCAYCGKEFENGEVLSSDASGQSYHRTIIGCEPQYIDCWDLNLIALSKKAGRSVGGIVGPLSLNYELNSYSFEEVRNALPESVELAICGNLGENGHVIRGDLSFLKRLRVPE